MTWNLRTKTGLFLNLAITGCSWTTCYQSQRNGHNNSCLNTISGSQNFPEHLMTPSETFQITKDASSLQTQKLVHNLFFFCFSKSFHIIMLWNLTHTVSPLAHSPAQVLRCQQTTLESLACRSLDNRFALGYLSAEQGSVCTVANSLWFGF